MRNWDKKIKDAEIRLEELNKELKEKEQENRISKLKIKEMRRLLKHNQLKPLNDDNTQTNSQAQLAQLNKDNLSKHNQHLKEGESPKEGKK